MKSSDFYGALMDADRCRTNADSITEKKSSMKVGIKLSKSTYRAFKKFFGQSKHREGNTLEHDRLVKLPQLSPTIRGKVPKLFVNQSRGDQLSECVDTLAIFKEKKEIFLNTLHDPISTETTFMERVSITKVS